MTSATIDMEQHLKSYGRRSLLRTGGIDQMWLRQRSVSIVPSEDASTRLTVRDGDVEIAIDLDDAARMHLAGLLLGSNATARGSS